MTPTQAALTFLAAMAVAAPAPDQARAAEDIEGPQYEVIDTKGDVELRRYAPYIVAETTVEAPSRDAASSMGFRPLAGYIFGGNTSRDEIAMTAPVTTRAAGQEIAMTAPVTTKEDGSGSYTIRFTMPSKWTMDTLPVPNDPSVTLSEVPAETRLALRFVGYRSADRIAEADAALLDAAAEMGLALAPAPMVAGYDGPSVPRSERRWEVMRIVEQ